MERPLSGFYGAIFINSYLQGLMWFYLLLFCICVYRWADTCPFLRWKRWWSRMCPEQHGPSEYRWVPGNLESCCPCRGPSEVKYLCSVCTMIDDSVTKQVLALRICSSSCSWGILWGWSSPTWRSCIGTPDLLAKLEGQSLGWKCNAVSHILVKWDSAAPGASGMWGYLKLRWLIKFLCLYLQNSFLLWMQGALHAHI